MTIDAPHIRIELREGVPAMAGQARWHSVPAPADPATGVMRAAWDWDGEVLQAEVDPYGFFSLFVYEKDGVVAVSPSLLELVARGCDPTPDPLALAVFHRLGIFVNDETPLRYVRTLPPRGRLSWRQGRLEIGGGIEIPHAQQITRDGAVEGMVELFRSAMTRILARIDGPMVLPLSGGRDSRHILLEMLHQGRKPETCVTFHHNGMAMNREAQAARAVCARLGVMHDVLGHARPRLADTVRALVMTGLCADEHAQMMPLHDYMAARPVTAFDGIAGDILTNPDDFADRFYRMSETGDWAGIAQGMMAGHGAVVSTPEWGRGAGLMHSPSMDEAVRDHVARAIAQYADAPDPYQLFWMYHRTRREVNFVPQAVLSQAEIVYTPYLDTEFADFCMSLPYRVTFDQQLHNDAIARAYPHVADIPFQEDFAEPVVSRGSVVHKARSLRDAWRISGVLSPDDRIGALRRWLGPCDKLKRAPGDVYDLHALCLDRLDAARAREILDLAAVLTRDAPSALITDRLDRRA